jgi:hypothetical protein
MESETYSEMFDYYLLKKLRLSAEICKKNTGRFRERQTFWPWVAVCYIFVVVDGFAHEGVWLVSRILIEFPCNIVQELPSLMVGRFASRWS